jgi:hypothetical protein
VNGPVKVRIRDRIAGQLVARNAISRDSAIAFQPKGRLERWLFARRRRSGAILEAGSGRYYLDVAAYHARFSAWERRAVPISFFVALGLALLLMLFYI